VSGVVLEREFLGAHGLCIHVYYLTLSAHSINSDRMLSFRNTCHSLGGCGILRSSLYGIQGGAARAWAWS
jgi:hypothetical protein